MLIVRKILQHINLDAEVDNHDKIHEIIEKDIVFRGTNLWILIFAILIASVGLNMNSTAVIIGAMLISPLMGPINGIGYSIATYNFPLFYRAVKNYTFAVVAGLTTSTLYFAISPISSAYSELLARTSPTIYDVLIAFFGGLAGIVAISSKQKGNVIPGVAIATALMPPLCTAGFGLATGQFHYFFGAIYLFTINSVFIALASLLVSQILKFPIRALISDSHKKKINRIISFVGILIIIPSLYFGYQLVEKERFLKNANLFVKSISIYEGNFLLKYEIDPVGKNITLAYGGRTLTDREKQRIEDKKADFQLHKAKVTFRQGLTIDQIDEKQAEVESLKSQLNRLNYLIEVKDAELDSLKNRKLAGRQILQEANALFPDIFSISYSDTYLFKTGSQETEIIDVIVFGMKERIPQQEEITRIERWLKTRLKSPKIRVYYEVSAPANDKTQNGKSGS